MGYLLVMSVWVARVRASRQGPLRPIATEMLTESVDQIRVTIGAEKGCDRKKFAKDLRSQQITPQVARKQRPDIDGHII